ncbi:M10 family metallopeptidase C-terminal domain-containing protein [Massilia sp. W12]|uniref:M10 family metallopeptidase C-terminal domain-containing protein n=1 Tax=Massilia sp. W12 TaxID=3126507 RepID=UPI0030D46CD6
MFPPSNHMRGADEAESIHLPVLIGGLHYQAQGGNDTVYADGGRDWIEGGAGDDELHGGAGPDLSAQASTLHGGDGDDLLNGGGNHDVLHGDAGDDRLLDLFGNNWLQGDSGKDSLHSGAGHDSLYGGEGDDYLQDDGGRNLLDGGAGNDQLTVENGIDGASILSGGDGNDQLIIDAGNNRLDGGGGNDSLYGGSGNDTLSSGEGDDFLSGGDGDDVLHAGLGLVTMEGGMGDDVYYVNTPNQVVKDAGGQDRIVVNCDLYKLPADIEQVDYNGHIPLPYWIDAMIPVEANAFIGSNGGFGQAHVFKYIFLETMPAYFDASDSNGFAPFNAAQKAAALEAMRYIESIANVQFVETTEPNARDVLAFAANIQVTSSGYAYFPEAEFYGSDVHIDISPGNDSNLTMQDGSYGVYTMIHEIGHALGLRHPFQINSEPPPWLQGDEDSSAWTVMSYISYQADYHLQMKPFDIAAMQYLYGPPTHKAKNDVLVVQPDAPNLFWDSGGEDTIDGSELTQDMHLHLRPGHWDFVGGKAEKISAAGQISINPGSKIEAASGGSGNDVINGNELDNLLSGGGGNDVLDGEQGHDVLQGGAGDDTLHGGSGNDTLIGGAGWDVARFPLARAQYQIEKMSETSLRLTQLGADGERLSILLDQVESMQFADRSQRAVHYLALPELHPGPMLGKGEIKLSGVAAPNALLTLFGTAADGVEVKLAELNTDAAGQWQWRQAHASGELRLRAEISDAQGFAAESVVLGQYRVDSSAPQLRDVRLDTHADGSLPWNRLGLQARTDSDARLLLNIDGGPVIIASPDGQGQVSMLLDNLQLQAGRHRLDLQVKDAAGNAGVLQTLFVQVKAPQVMQGSAQDERLVLPADGMDWVVHGGGGVDTLVLPGAREAYRDGVQIQARFDVHSAASISFAEIERIEYADKGFAHDVEWGGAAGNLLRLYQTAFGRMPDPGGAGFWLKQAGSANLSQLGHLFANSTEFLTLHPKQTEVALQQSIDLLYQQGLQRHATQSELVYWQQQIGATGHADFGPLLYSICVSEEARLIGVTPSVLEYYPQA